MAARTGLRRHVNMSPHCDMLYMYVTCAYNCTLKMLRKKPWMQCTVLLSFKLTPADGGGVVCEQGLLRGTWSSSTTDDLMISLHFCSSVSWKCCWDSRSWAHSTWV